MGFKIASPLEQSSHVVVHLAKAAGHITTELTVVVRCSTRARVNGNAKHLVQGFMNEVIFLSLPITLRKRARRSHLMPG